MKEEKFNKLFWEIVFILSAIAIAYLEIKGY
jgi:hypothetical protein